MDWLADMPVILAGFLGSLATGLATGLGALPIFARQRWNQGSQVAMLAFAGGVMLAAAFFSLLVPALAIVTERSGSSWQAGAVVGTAVILGALAVWGLNVTVPHEHFMKGPEGASAVALGRNWLFILAITLHNFPEGLSVGVGFGGGVTTGLAVTLGIGLQNLPEGLAVAAALCGDGFTRRRAFWIALLTGLVEPIGGLLGAGAVSLSAIFLPWGLAFAGGAMLYVVSSEIIPETHRNGRERLATLSVMVGFVLMMFLDVALG